MIYLDYNASVPLRPHAKDALLAALDLEGNAASPHLAGRKLRSLIEGARKEILKGLGGKQLIFTSGGTEANALALSGLGTIPVVISTIEHESVLKAVPAPHFAPVTSEGVVDLSTLQQLLSSFEKPGLLSIMLVNNETGVIQPLKEVVQIAHSQGWKIHTDASQALGHLPFSFEELGVDMMTISSHKCGGPVGVGALILREDLHLMPLIRGGGQEYGMRSGTLSAPLILGFAAAVTESLHEGAVVSRRFRNFQQKIEATLSEAIIYGKGVPRVSHVTCLGMPSIPAELQIVAFDLKGIAVSAGSACSSGKMKESRVLAAMGIPLKEAQCGIRVSMGWKTREDEIETFTQEWKAIYAQSIIKKVS